MKTHTELVLEAAVAAGYVITHWKRDPFDVLATHPSEPEVEFRLHELIKLIGEPRQPAPPAQPEPDDTQIMQLAAISTACLQNTEKTIKDRIGPDSPYWTQAYRDVCTAVDREMRERKRAQTAEEIAERLSNVERSRANSLSSLTKRLRTALRYIAYWRLPVGQTLVDALDPDRAKEIHSLLSSDDARGSEPGPGEALLYCRCPKHYNTVQINRNEASGGECGACIQEELINAQARIEVMHNAFQTLKWEHDASAREARETGNSEGFTLWPQRILDIVTSMIDRKLPTPILRTSERYKNKIAELQEFIREYCPAKRGEWLNDAAFVDFQKRREHALSDNVGGPETSPTTAT